MFQVLSGPIPLSQHSTSFAARRDVTSTGQTVSEVWEVFFLVMVALGGTVPILVPATGTVGTGYTMSGSQLGFLRIVFDAISAVFFGHFLFAAYRVRFRIPWHLTSVRLACAFVAYAASSMAWGVSPLKESFLRTIFLIGILSYTFYLFQHYSPRHRHLLIAAACGVLAMSSIFMAVVLPHYGVDSNGNNGAWQGVYAQKNPLGTGMVLALVCALTMPRGNSFWKGGLIVASIIPLIGSQSRESWIAALTCVMGLALVRGIFLFNRKDRISLLVTALCLVAISAAMVITYNKQILALMGRNATFSGRTKIWAAVYQHLVVKRPVTGYGISGAIGTSLWAPVDVAIHWKSDNATHNSFLDLLFRFGIIGSSIIAGALLLGMKNATKIILSGSADQVEFPVVLLLAMLTCGIGGHGLFQVPGLQLVLFFLALFQLESQAKAPERVDAFLIRRDAVMLSEGRGITVTAKLGPEND